MSNWQKDNNSTTLENYVQFQEFLFTLSLNLRAKIVDDFSPDSVKIAE